MAGYLLVHGENGWEYDGADNMEQGGKRRAGMTGRVIARDRRKTERVVGDERR